MRRSRRNQPLLIALYLNAALLLAVLVALLARGNSGLSSTAYGALSPQPIAGGASLYLMPAQFTQNSWGCYILDIDTQTLCAYRYHPTNDGSDLQLVAARKVTYDRKLTHFNSDRPSPEEVKQLVENAAAGIRGQTDPTTAPSTNTGATNTTEKTPGTPR